MITSHINKIDVHTDRLAYEMDRLTLDLRRDYSLTYRDFTINGFNVGSYIVVSTYQSTQRLLYRTSYVPFYFKGVQVIFKRNRID